MKGEVKERGMIFNDEMVRAILGGNKTQTRRIVEEKFYGRAVAAELLAKHCPYGQPGDRIWVRETYRVHGKATDVATLVYRASVRNSWTEQTHRVPVEVCNKPVSEKWTPSIHMPRWASRILLEITNVRVERLNDISECDARDEGVPPAGSLLLITREHSLLPRGISQWPRLRSSACGNPSTAKKAGVLIPGFG